MTVEAASFISQLDATYPASGDAKSEGDNHLRLLKSTIKATFPNVSNAVTPTHTELNYVSGVTSAIQTQLAALVAVDATKASTAALAALDAAKAPLAGPTFTGQVTVPTPSNPTDAATKAYVDALSMAAGNVPLGGTTGQYLKKNSATNYDMDWAVIPSTAGGATITSSAVDVTLTSASDRVQSLAMTVADKSVYLPNATTLSEGGALFVIKNTGALNYAVRANGGGLLANLTPGQTAVFYLTDNSTAAGTWAIGDESVGTAFSTPIVGTVTTVQATTTSYAACVALSSTSVLAFYLASTTLTACLLTISGTSISAGTPFSSASTGIGGAYIACSLLSSTTAIVTYANSSGYPCARHITVSGATITEGSEAVVNAAATNGTSVTSLSGTVAVITYTGASTYPRTSVLTVSGTSISAGTLLLLNAQVADFTVVQSVSSTGAVVVYRGASGYLYGKVLAISGSTVTAGVEFQINSVITSQASLSFLTATTVLVNYKNTSSGYLESRVLTASGTTLTTGAATALTYASASPALAPISAGGWLAHVDENNYLSAIKATVASGVVSCGGKSTINAVSSSAISATTLSSSVFLIMYRGTSGYPQAVVLEFA